ncbi:serine/threonine kinase [Aureococcus anophagefferens]|nr:serine/threonine kinase [Aureococcus anophagefferens]
MASVDVLYETPFPQRSTTRVKNACAWDGTGRLVLTPTATREARTGTVDEGQKQSGCPAPLELRRQTAGAGAPCRSASWSPVGLAWDGGALLATVSATGACAVFEPPRCWADYAWATVDDVAAARPGADRLAARSSTAARRLRLAPSANGLCAAEIAEEPDFAKRAEGFARLRVRALGARDAALGNADLRARPADFLWLGTGAFSRVVKATKRMANNEAGQAVAVKCITKTPDLKAEDIASLRRRSRCSTRGFGFAKKVNGKSLDTQCGTPGYVAPEILKGPSTARRSTCGPAASSSTSCWGYPPFHGDNHAILYRKIKAADYTFEPQYWDQVSDDAKDLIKKMLVVDPDKRLTADQAPPWFLVGDHELISRNLSTTLDTMKKFNARRKFRGTVKGIMLTNKMARGFN